jgi:hypothetical protein
MAVNKRWRLLLLSLDVPARFGLYPHVGEQF